MNDIKVTVYAVAYNHEKYIRKTLESIVAQKTNFKFEVLVHDDASTDKTPEIIKEFAQKYPDIIKPILQTENQYSKKINLPLAFLFPQTNGKYVATCECDDYWANENKLQMQYEIMESNPNVSMCVHKVQCVNEDGTLNPRVIPEKNYRVETSGVISQEEFADMLFFRGEYPFHTSSYFRKRELVADEIVAGLPMTINGDQKVLYSALNAGDIFYIDEALSHRRLMAIGSYNSRLQKKSYEEKQEMYVNKIKAEVLFDELSNRKFHKQVVKSVISRIFELFKARSAKELVKDFHEINKKLKFDWGISYKTNIKYVLVKYFPYQLSLLLKTLKKIRRN